MRRGDTLCFEKAPVIRAFAAVGGKREGRGPLRRGFDRLYTDNYLGQPSWEKAEQAQAQYEEALAQAKAEAGEIVKAADRTAAAHSEEILEDARRQAQAMLAKAEADIAQQRKKAVNEVKDELGGIAVDIASKVVEREVRPEDHAKLIDEFIQNVGDAS